MDLFPKQFEQLKEVKKKLQIEPGNIYLMYLTTEDGIVVPQGEIMHPKMVLIIGVDKDRGNIYGNLFINSNINPKIYHTEEERADHFPIFHKDYPHFIKPDHDPSFVNCSLIKEYTIDRVLSETYIGSLKPDDFSKVKSLIEKTKQIQPKIKKRYGIQDLSRLPECERKLK